uniref:Uncharacterized protein n=1 Tax=Magallana gigas TaxID=29159 RepID=K1R495_MAGGI
MNDICLHCNSRVRPLQEGLQCDRCNLWQHRTCNTGITRAEYRRLKAQGEFQWECTKCSRNDQPMPAADSDDSTVPAPNDATFHISLADDSAVPAPDDVDDNNTSAVADNSAVPAPDDEDDNNTSVDENNNLNGSVNLHEDNSFAADASYAVPDAVQETSIREDIINDAIQPEDPQPAYEVVEGGSKRGKKKLVDRRGYQYTIRVKQNARQNIFTCSAPRIVEEVMSKSADVNAPPASRPKPANLTRMANRVRLTMRPKDPKDLDFEEAIFSPDMSHLRTRANPNCRKTTSKKQPQKGTNGRSVTILYEGSGDYEGHSSPKRQPCSFEDLTSDQVDIILNQVESAQKNLISTMTMTDDIVIVQSEEDIASQCKDCNGTHHSQTSVQTQLKDIKSSQKALEKKVDSLLEILTTFVKKQETCVTIDLNTSSFVIEPESTPPSKVTKALNNILTTSVMSTTAHDTSAAKIPFNTSILDNTCETSTTRSHFVDILN